MKFQETKRRGGNAFQKALVRRGHGLTKAGMMLGTSRPYLSQIMNGHRMPGRKLMFKMKRVYDVPLGAWAPEDNDTPIR